MGTSRYQPIGSNCSAESTVSKATAPPGGCSARRASMMAMAPATASAAIEVWESVGNAQSSSKA